MSIYYITSNTCHFLSKEFEKVQRKERRFLDGDPEIRTFKNLPINLYLLGSDKKIIKEAILLRKRGNGSCGMMASITTSTLTKAYLKLAKTNLIACGLARVGPYVGIGEFWSGFAGTALWNINNAIILSVNKIDIDKWGVLSADTKKYILKVRK